MRKQLLQNFTLYERYETMNCIYWFYDVLCWYEAKEGVLFTLEDYIDDMLIRFDKYYNNKPLPFISNRVNSYSFNTMDPVNLQEFQMISCLFTISYSESDLLQVKFGKQFWKKPFVILKSPEEAEIYLKEALKKPEEFCPLS